METLTQMKCVACRADAPTVTDTEMAEFHRQVSDWEIVELDGIKRLRRVFSVDDFAQALEVTKKVGALAEAEGSTTWDGERTSPHRAKIRSTEARSPGANPSAPLGFLARP